VHDGGQKYRNAGLLIIFVDGVGNNVLGCVVSFFSDFDLVSPGEVITCGCTGVSGFAIISAK